jgi:type IV secretory pathway component VirB8
MSEIKSPFLDDNKETTDENKIDSKNSDFNKHRIVDGTVNNESLVQTNIGDIKNISEDDSEESLEIQEEGRLLKRLIIIMIILLVAALIWLFLYNALHKKEDFPVNDNVETLNNNLNINDFDMRGEKFQAKSIIIEE